MSKRIQELIEQAGFTANDPDKVFLRVFEAEIEKFAELISEECNDALAVNAKLVKALMDIKILAFVPDVTPIEDIEKISRIAEEVLNNATGETE